MHGHAGYPQLKRLWDGRKLNRCFRQVEHRVGLSIRHNGRDLKLGLTLRQRRKRLIGLVVVPTATGFAVTRTMFALSRCAWLRLQHHPEAKL